MLESKEPKKVQISEERLHKIQLCISKNKRKPFPDELKILIIIKNN